MRDKINYSNLSVNYENVLREREILTKETLFSQTKAAKFQLKIENLEHILQREIQQKEKLEQTLQELKNNSEKIIININMNMAKIEKEQKYLLESAKAIIQLNKRLQTFGLCFHAINQKNKVDIKNLQHKLITLSVNEFMQSSNINTVHPEIENLHSKLKKMLMELKLKMQNIALYEEKLNIIFNELSINLTQIQQ
ncbi:uncharacterized protein LOC105736071 [Apis florea]|uniref:uncharacterized protein LOC105736071 n=1 Tax=Apis florea TaxID=7463 RepID=UPI0012FED672|nr:uncharacterized protein LOC105736071 [Apis florea]